MNKKNKTKNKEKMEFLKAKLGLRELDKKVNIVSSGTFKNKQKNE